MDHYATLGVAKTATPDDIKKAYRRLASQHHPDKGGDTNTFQKIQSAYDVLSDPIKRQQYDNPQPEMPHGFSFHSNQFDINDIFARMFGQQFSQTRTGPQKQLFRTQVEIGLKEAYTGTNHVMKMASPTGAKILNINVPKGIDNGDQVRYDNLLENGVLIVEFRVRSDVKYDRKGANLYANQSVSVLDLIVGTTFPFMTISGKTLEVKVPPMTQPFMSLKIPNEGMPIPNSNQYGDQIILIKPFVPDTIDSAIVEAIQQSKNKQP